MRKFSLGFTIIELLIVISIMMVLSVVSFASYSSYNTAQKLNTSTLAVKSMLQYAKAQSSSQVNTCPVGQTLTGYQVLACCQGNKCPACSGKNDYEVDIVCSGGTTFLKGDNLPTGTVFDTNNSTSYSYLFNTLTGSVTGVGTLTITQGSTQKSLSVSSAGVIQ